MSSIESMISEIEEDYHRIQKSFESRLTTEDYYRFNEVSEDDLLSLLKDTMKFQRKIEEIIASIKRIAGKTSYEKRLEQISSRVLERLTSDKQFDSVRFRVNPAGYSFEDISVEGIITELRYSHNKLLHSAEVDYRRGCFRAYFGFKSLSCDLVELEEELRLIGALTTYPIEKKTRMKQELVTRGFEETAISLEEAESNTEAEHFRDCVSRCRDAMEIFVALVREKETGEKTERHFATDLAKLVKSGIFDEGTQKLAQGVYSFNSLKGSHKYDEKKVTIYDAETALNETYALIEMLLKRYLELKKT